MEMLAWKMLRGKYIFLNINNSNIMFCTCNAHKSIFMRTNMFFTHQKLIFTRTKHTVHVKKFFIPTLTNRWPFARKNARAVM